jgi:hypothetical protein
MKQNYRQCSLQKGNVHQVSFIPEKYAVVGKVLKLKEQGVWIDGWVVHGIGELMSEDEVPDSYKAIKKHRASTGDSLPK